MTADIDIIVGLWISRNEFSTERDNMDRRKEDNNNRLKLVLGEFLSDFDKWSELSWWVDENIQSETRIKTDSSDFMELIPSDVRPALGDILLKEGLLLYGCPRHDDDDDYIRIYYARQTIVVAGPLQSLCKFITNHNLTLDIAPLKKVRNFYLDEIDKISHIINHLSKED